MIEACEELERLDPEEGIVRVAEIDWRFHHALIDTSGNRRLSSVYQHAPLPLLIPDETSGPAWQAQVHATAEEHRPSLTPCLQAMPRRLSDCSAAISPSDPLSSPKARSDGLGHGTPGIKSDVEVD